MRNIESNIQIVCVNWFRYQYQHLAKMLFAVPNGGYRHYRTGAILKAEGQLAGVSDLILLIPRGVHNSLCIEMKAPKGKQSNSQVEWQKEAEKHGNKYVICHSIEEFRKEVEQYLRE